MKHHMVTGGGGTRLHLIETGNPSGRPIVFIHGFSQCSLAWARQMNSELADTFRLVAMDMRGHGLSDKPRDQYGDSKLWADDVHAVIEALQLDRPVLCGWSYGPLVILDYIRHYGENSIRGLNFVGGVTKLGSDEAASVLGADFLKLLPGFFSTDAQESVGALDSLVRMCVASDLAALEVNLSAWIQRDAECVSTGFGNVDGPLDLPRLRRHVRRRLAHFGHRDPTDEPGIAVKRGMHLLILR